MSLFRPLRRLQAVESPRKPELVYTGEAPVILKWGRYFSFLIIVAPEITTHPQNATKTECEDVTLYCNASGNPATTISWIKNGSLLDTEADDSNITFGAENKSLTIICVMREHSGQYQCVGSNILGNATSNAATLDVQCKFSLMFTKIESKQLKYFFYLFVTFIF